VRHRKARRPATADAVREAHASFQAGKLKRRDATSPHTALSVYDGRCHIGFLLLRGKAGVEAFDADDRSLGLFPDTKTAAAAISARAAS
jgi:hypothetical protein